MLLPHCQASQPLFPDWPDRPHHPASQCCLARRAPVWNPPPTEQQLTIGRLLGLGREEDATCDVPSAAVQARGDSAHGSRVGFYESMAQQGQKCIGE